MSNSYFEKGTSEYREFLAITRQLEELLETYPQLKKLQEHSVKGWVEHILLDALFDMANIGYALVLEKQLISLAEDLKKSKSKYLKFKVSELSNELNILLNKNAHQKT